MPVIDADAVIPFVDEASIGARWLFADPRWFAGFVRRLNCISGTFLGCACSRNAERAYGLLGNESRNDL